MRYECKVCAWIYDPENPPEGVEVDTAFEELPEDFVCPECGAAKEEFVAEE
ncbi:MAG: rubredoxin [Planctomycetota bacterium]|nr:rubredoxin [Planctomycetota bacterium]